MKKHNILKCMAKKIWEDLGQAIVTTLTVVGFFAGIAVVLWAYVNLMVYIGRAMELSDDGWLFYVPFSIFILPTVLCFGGAYLIDVYKECKAKPSYTIYRRK